MGGKQSRVSVWLACMPSVVARCLSSFCFGSRDMECLVLFSVVQSKLYSCVLAGVDDDHSRFEYRHHYCSSLYTGACTVMVVEVARDGVLAAATASA